jgi:hypothetical protein
MNIEALKEAINNENNSSIIYTNISEIKKIKNDTLQQIGLNRDNLKDFNKKLKNYRYIDNINDLTCGNYIRTINLEKIDKIKLNNNVIICEIDSGENGSLLKVRTFNNNYFILYFEKNLIFQKITDQETLILKAINYLEK